MEHLRQGIGLRSFAQKNPKHEYQREAYKLFEQTMDAVRLEFVSTILRMDIRKAPVTEYAQKQESDPNKLECKHSDPSRALAGAPLAHARHSPSHQRKAKKTSTIVHRTPKPKRNDPCHCGSGRSTNTATAVLRKLYRK